MKLKLCEKEKQLNKIYQEYTNEFKDQQIVFGSGNIKPRLLLIGEAPGKEEVKQSKPFVGASGKNLSEFLNVLKVSRQDIYITNVVKYRLTKRNIKTNGLINRPPTRKEVETNKHYLIKEIDIIKPQYIITLGNTSLKALTNNYDSNIGKYHGEITSVKLLESEYLLFPLYHPASIIYNRQLKDTYMEDIKKLKIILNQD